MAEEKARLVVESAENKMQLEVTENKILDVLSSSKGNILEDEEAVKVLSASKQLSNEIAEKQQIADQTEMKIDAARLQYVPVAFKTAVLFFCIADLANIDPMYQYSLPFFIGLFKAAIDKSEPASEIDQRIENLNKFFMKMLYNNICRSLFEQHKLLFSFLLTTRLQVTTGELSMTDYRFLLTGGISLEDPPPKPADWIPDRCWSEIFRMAKMCEDYAKVLEGFHRDIRTWKRIYDSGDPLKLMQDEMEKPAAMKNFSRFQELLVLRCVRPDRVLAAILLYVSSCIGEPFVTPPPFDLAGSYSDSSSISPLIFILSPGADPFSALNMFGAEKGKQINGISLGQGQGPKAEKMMEEAMKSGGWVLLQNCHLATTWMPKLDKILEQLDPKEVSYDFRLWLTSYPSNKFPVAILQNSVKITNEAPKGLRANLVGSFLMDPISSEEFFERSATPLPFKRLLFSLCFFHAVIQERRLFGPLGWNIPYEFTQNDLRISVRQLQMFIDESDDVPFKALCYLTGECNYGGRVTDDKDRRLLTTLLDDYYCPAVLVSGHPLCGDHPEYVVPQPGTHESMLEDIRNLPLIDPPGVYGFHENANLTREQNETYIMMDNLLLTVGSSSGGGGSSAEDTIKAVADDILGRLPQPWDLVVVQETYPTMYEESMNTVLIQELTRFNVLIRVITSSLKDIQKAIKGLLLLSAQLETVFQSIFDGKTPAMWLNSSYPSLKPLGSYTNDLVERLKFFQTWVDHGIPVLFWISGIYFTQAFTTGAAQNFARRYAIAIDTLTFNYEMPKNQEPTVKPDNGVYTQGIFLEGCKWDWNLWELAESDPKVLFVPVPLVWIVPCKVSDSKSFPSYEGPLYKVSSRKGILSTTGHSTNFVMMITLPSSMPESHWVKRGVAMLTQLDS
uniref:Dynein heavy chain n=1 Tax=Noctiluca scintillans TaxID=2966 RepID=A0A7S1AC22_NOCSC